jgi:hypothetical protein
LRSSRAPPALLYRAALSPHTPKERSAAHSAPTAAEASHSAPLGAEAEMRRSLPLKERAQRTNLGIDDIVPEALHRKVGWDIRHHFMAEKIVDRFGLQLPRDRELVRQLAVVYVLGGLKAPPSAETARNTD